MARQLPGSTDRITSALTANNSQRSYSIWVYRIGDGANNLGRIWHKGTSGGTLDTSHNNNAAGGTYDYNRRYSVSNGIWTYPRPAVNEWHHIAIAHDLTADTNAPTIWLDAVQQSLTVAQVASGTVADNNTQPYCWGNRNDDGSRGWNGILAEIAVWNRLITATEVLGLANGTPAFHYPAALISYSPLKLASVIDMFQSANTLTGTTEAPDPPIYRALRVNNLRPAIFKPGRPR